MTQSFYSTEKNVTLIHSQAGIYFRIKIKFAFSFRGSFYYEKKAHPERKK